LTAPITAAASEHQRLRTAAQTGEAATTACKNARRWLLLAGEGQRSNALSWTSILHPERWASRSCWPNSAAGLLSRFARSTTTASARRPLWPSKDAKESRETPFPFLAFTSHPWRLPCFDLCPRPSALAGKGVRSVRQPGPVPVPMRLDLSAMSSFQNAQTLRNTFYCASQAISL